MPDVRLFVRAIDYVSDQGAPVRAWQPYARVEFIAQNGILVPCECIVDSGAPLSVLPYSLWRGRNLQYTTLGTQLTLSQTGMAALEALLWMGEGCELAETTIFLLDPDSAARTGPHRVVAKVVLQPFSGARKRFERIVLLGENFLADNGIGLVQQSVGGTLTGYLSVPIP